MKNRYLVVDTNIARAASGDPAKTGLGIGREARALLNFVKNNNISLVFTVDLTREWNEHSSAFSKKIKAALQSRNKIIRIPSGNNERIEMNAAVDKVKDNDIRNVILKDIHLLEGAFHDNCYTVVSNDIRIANHFRNHYGLLNVFNNMHDVKWFEVKDNEFIFSYVKNECSIINGEYSILP